MVKHRRRRNRNFGVIRVQNSQPLGTLGDNTVISITLAAVTQEMYAIAADLLWNIRGGTSGEGPVMIGLAHGDYTITEIKEAIEADVTSQGTKIEQEQARRQVRDVGYIGDVGPGIQFNDGKIKRTKLGFSIEDGQDVQGFAYNLHGSPLTTGGSLEVTGKIYVNWK